ncbi:hypothetical protein HPB47_014411, partial [Ixodes persulcatus]
RSPTTRMTPMLLHRLFQEKARKLTLESKLGNFNAFSQYLSRRKKRFNVSFCATTKDSQKLPINIAEAVWAFRKTVGTLHLQHDYSDFSIPNLDQTMPEEEKEDIGRYMVNKSLLKMVEPGPTKTATLYVQELLRQIFREEN